MRLLHAWAVDEREGAARAQSAFHTGRGARSDDRQYLPVLQLQPLRGGGNGRLSETRFHNRRRASMTPLNTLGHATPRIDALKRVNGAATYTGDIHLPGM